MPDRTYGGYPLERIERAVMNEWRPDTATATDLIAHIRELEADLAATKRKAAERDEAVRLLRGMFDVDAPMCSLDEAKSFLSKIEGQQ